MRLLKGMMAILAAIFILGYVNSCDSEPNDQISNSELYQNDSNL